jgi:miniconductance mechanosensitive channel
MSFLERLNFIRLDLIPAASYAIIALLMAVSYFAAKYVVLRVLVSVWLRPAKRAHWITLIQREGLIRQISFIAPLILFDIGRRFFDVRNKIAPDQGHADLFEGLMQVFDAFFYIVVLLIFDRILRCVDTIYSQSSMATQRPLKAFVQFARILLLCVGMSTIILLALGQSPWKWLTGLGAASTVFLIIFRDTLLSFMASLQLASNGLVKVGDWIEIPDSGVDGNVVEMGLHTARIQNWDKTIVSIPLTQLMSQAFKNWRGMQEYGARRFKRVMVIEHKTVRFCDLALLERLLHVDLISDLVEKEIDKVRKFRESLCGPDGEFPSSHVMETRLLNGPYLTNIDLFQTYLARYLEQDENVSAKGTIMVRQLAPSGTGGLPIEIYCFLEDIDWASFEKIQGRIYAAFLSAVYPFDLQLHSLGRGYELAAIENTQAQDSV